MTLHRGDKIGIVGCSNAQLLSYKAKIDLLLAEITELGLVPVCSNCIYEKYSVFSGTAIERAAELNRLMVYYWAHLHRWRKSNTSRLFEIFFWIYWEIMIYRSL